MSVRQEFEEWYLGLHGSTRDDLHTEPEGDVHMEKGDYYDLGARMMWQAYQAAHKAQQAEIERITKIKDLALAYIKESPCDPDIYPEQLEAWMKLLAALEGNQ